MFSAIHVNPYIAHYSSNIGYKLSTLNYCVCKLLNDFFMPV